MTTYIIGVVIAWIALTADDMRTGHYAPIGALMVSLCWPLIVGAAVIFACVAVPLFLIAMIVHGVPAWIAYRKEQKEQRDEG